MSKSWQHQLAESPFPQPVACAGCGRVIRVVPRGDGTPVSFEAVPGGAWSPAGGSIARVGKGRGSFALHTCKRRPPANAEQLKLGDMP